MKTSRGRVNGRYIRRSWFRHNDKSIREHYIDNFTRKNGPSEWTWSETLSRMTHMYTKIAQMAETLPLKPDDGERLFSALQFKMKVLEAKTIMIAFIDMKTKYDRENIPVPKSLQSGYYFAIQYMNHETRQRWYEEELFEKDPYLALEYTTKVQTSDPLFRELSKIYMKYLRPPRLERNKIRNEKLKERYNYPERTLPNLIQPVDS